MREHWLKLVGDNDARVGSFIALQVADPRSPERGAMGGAWGGGEWGFADPKPALNLGSAAIAAYLNPDSSFRGEGRALAAAELALGYAERVQLADGLFDYRPCNFHSAPDTAFIVNRVVQALKLALASGDPALADFSARLRALVLRAGEGMAANGFHTPNHRWALAAALSSCARLSPDEAARSRFSEAASRYLAEGIDCSAEGEWAERSAGNYNAVSNDQMIILAEELGDGSYLDHVERNLEMMLSYVEPDGSVFTNNSTRQDRGRRTYLDQYWFEFLYLARRRGRADFAAVARDAMGDIIRAGRPAPDVLDQLMLYLGGVDYGEAWAPPAEAAGIAPPAPRPPAPARPAASVPSSYRRLYAGSGIARLRRGEWSLSLVRGSGNFLYFQSGSLSARLRLALVYFDKRELRPASLEEEGGALVLRCKAAGWYYLPFEEAPGTSDWWEMDNAARPRQEGPDLDFELRVSELGSGEGVELRAIARGTAGVPLRFELGLTAGSRVETEHFRVEGAAGGFAQVKDGELLASLGADGLAVGPAFSEHGSLGGGYSEPRSPDHFTAILTALTPFDKVLAFRRVPPARF
ncbi:MAG TPA: hypothetical protein PLB91_08145 [Spirochaetales bacterium]|nr:hypothetical protein [Spirochaetales bacterium]